VLALLGALFACAVMLAVGGGIYWVLFRYYL
jgi:hypothetical protein